MFPPLGTTVNLGLCEEVGGECVMKTGLCFIFNKFNVIFKYLFLAYSLIIEHLTILHHNASFHFKESFITDAE